MIQTWLTPLLIATEVYVAERMFSSLNDLSVTYSNDRPGSEAKCMILPSPKALMKDGYNATAVVPAWTSFFMYSFGFTIAKM